MAQKNKIMPGTELFGAEERKEIEDVLSTGILFRYNHDALRNNIWKAKDFEAEADGETFIKLAGEYAAHYDSAARAYPIDSLDGKAFDGMLYLLTLAKVPANSTITLPFTANTKASGNPEFYVYSYHPNRYGSKGTEHWSNMTNQVMEQGIDGLDMLAGKSKNKFFEAFTKSLKIGQKHLALAGATAGAYFDAKVNAYEVTAEMHGILNA